MNAGYTVVHIYAFSKLHHGAYEKKYVSMVKIETNTPRTPWRNMEAQWVFLSLRYGLNVPIRTRMHFLKRVAYSHACHRKKNSGFGSNCPKTAEIDFLEPVLFSFTIYFFQDDLPETSTPFVSYGTKSWQSQSTGGIVWFMGLLEQVRITCLETETSASSRYFCRTKILPQLVW